MEPENIKAIEFEIKNTMYYIDYPDSTSPGLWKDRNGKLEYICDMTLDHLKNCIFLVDKHIARLKESGRPTEVINALVPLATNVARELREEFTIKSKI